MKITQELLQSLRPSSKIYQVSDGNGLYIEIPVVGSMRWRIRYRFKGAETRLSLGLWPKVSLEDARTKASHIKNLIKQGINPSMDRNNITPSPLLEPNEQKPIDGTLIASLDLGTLRITQEKYTGQIENYYEYIRELRAIIYNAREELRKIG